MLNNTFITSAINEDSRNKFGVCQDVSMLPSALQEFYAQCNPLDVEIRYPELGAVKLYPVQELEELKSDYMLLEEDDWVFGTCDGDPLFIKDGKVYVSLPEIYKPELVAESFPEFLQRYIDSRH